MIGPIELLGTFYGNNIPDILNNTDDFLHPHWVRTDGAKIPVGNIMASLAKTDFTSHSHDGFSKSVHEFGVLPE